MDPVWLTAFLDFPPADFERGVAFWRAVTATSLSAPRGETEQFATLVPGDGDAFLRVQRLGEGPARVHLDVHRAGQDFEVCRSPGGFLFCEVGAGENARPRPVTWPAVPGGPRGDLGGPGHSSLVDQVCLDIPADRYETECAFWGELTGWPVRAGSRPEFRYLERPAGVPLRLLLQRLDEPTGPVRAHLDLATTDRSAETERHVALGAAVVGHGPRWTVLRDPVGTRYCVTDRSPVTGLLP
ncbi:VOC family protein [Frankia sp. CNm7]|uniref:VOC family protein n=1 Tax=Frankia nepalensis TaxID=1836974 RepID=A0A937UM31_9ACTN|nr:VOC family protein [Frankia nepalensis]MBL7497875.1 VOC family protein [Frankia nepalensis]MBL7515185.1 VOC family protein [Frankia nepalensis]MBL7518422.1 VOC family protein [Frankia nepalensis]MBL7628469.1 VOC family protein [Frankia nepalensis]